MKKSNLDDSVFANPLPVLSDPTTNSLAENEDVSVAELAALLPKNPVLFSRLLARANQSASKRGAQIFVADHVASYFGANRMLSMIQNYEKVEIEHAPYAFKVVLLASTLAYQLANAFATESRNQNTSELKYAALHWLQPFWYLSFSAPEVVLEYQKKRQQHPWQSIQFEAAFFGFPIVDKFMDSTGAEFLNNGFKTAVNDILACAPRPLTSLLRKNGVKLSPEEKRRLISNAVRAYFINELALEIILGDFERRANRLLLSLVKSFELRRDKVSLLLFRCIKVCIETPLGEHLNLMARYLAIPQQMSEHWPGNSQLSKASIENMDTVGSKQTKPEQPFAPVSPSVEEESKKPKAVPIAKKKPRQRPAIAYTEILSLCHQMSSSPGRYPNLKALAAAALQFFQESLHFDRCVLINISHKNQRSQGLISFGCESNKELGQFDLSLQEFGVLKKFLAQPAFLEFSRQKHEKVWHTLPRFLAEDTSTNRFLLSSLASGNRPNMLVYVDNSYHQWPFGEALVHSYRQYVKGLTLCLRHLREQQLLSKKKKQSIK